MSHHDRLLAAYPGLLPGFFTLTEGPMGSTRPVARAAWRDPSELDLPGLRARRHEADWRDLLDAYRDECVAAISVLLNHGDAVLVGDRVLVTAALSAEDFDRLAALGAEIEDYENDDPREYDDPMEDDGEDDDRVA